MYVVLDKIVLKLIYERSNFTDVNIKVLKKSWQVILTNRHQALLINIPNVQLDQLVKVHINLGIVNTVVPIGYLHNGTGF